MITPAMKRAYEYGAYWVGNNPITSLEQLATLDESHPISVAAFRRCAAMAGDDYVDLCRLVHGYTPAQDVGLEAVGDGGVGPVVTASLGLETDFEGRNIALERFCPLPDVPPPPGATFDYGDPQVNEAVKQWQDNAAQATGSGNWRNCHGFSNAHAVRIEFNMANIGGHLRSRWKETLTIAREASRLIGLAFLFTENGVDILTGKRVEGPANVQASFVTRSSGWIGLATVRNGLGCGDTRSWAKYLATYRPSDWRRWVTLILHEHGHNMGTGHTRGGIMNPSLGRTYTRWESGDPLQGWLRSRYSGQPIPKWWESDGPPPTPPPPGGWEQTIFTGERTDAYGKKQKGREVRIWIGE